MIKEVMIKEISVGEHGSFQAAAGARAGLVSPESAAKEREFLEQSVGL